MIIVAGGDGPAPTSVERGLDALSPTKRADVGLELKRIQVLDFGLKVPQGKFHDVEQCQRDRLAAIHEVKQGLLDLADSFPGSGEDKAILKGRIFELLRTRKTGQVQFYHATCEGKRFRNRPLWIDRPWLRRSAPTSPESLAFHRS